MRIVYFIGLLILLNIDIFSQDFEERLMYVNARSGLRVRSESSIDGRIIGVLQYGEFVRIISRSNNRTTIDGKTDYWYSMWFKVGNDSQRGWIFGGYLSETIPNDIPFFIGVWDLYADGERTPDYLYFDINNQFSCGTRDSGNFSSGTWRIDGNVIYITYTGYDWDTGEYYEIIDSERFIINVINNDNIGVTLRRWRNRESRFRRSIYGL